MSAPVELFRRLTNGVYVVTAVHAGTSDGFTAAWITQVAFDPLLIAISINPGNATWTLIRDSGEFVVNVLRREQGEVARRFGTASGRDVDKLTAAATRVTAGGVILSDGLAWLACRVEQHVTAGDHVVVIARVTGGDVLVPDAVPLRYSDTGDMDGSSGLYPAAFSGRGTPSA